MIYTIVTFHTQQHKTAAFVDVLHSVKHDLPKVNGCISVDIYRDTDADHIFTLVEKWETKAQHQHHIERLIHSQQWDAIAEHLEQDPTSHYCQAL